MPKRTSLAAIIVFALILSVTTYAFAASNTVEASSAGDGNAAISGFHVSDVVYTLGSDASLIDAVSFTLTPDGGSAATSASIQFNNAGSWYGCDVSGSTATCAVSGSVTALFATNLRVVAAQ